MNILFLMRELKVSMLKKMRSTRKIIARKCRNRYNVFIYYGGDFGEEYFDY